jgi:probable F420-dependent oxidoreductase
MKIDAMAGTFANAAQKSRAAEALGVDGVASTEVNHDPFFPLAAAALSTERVDLTTSITVAFARNPMTVALQARDLNDVSKGRFVLGLGSQIKAHVTRRYSMPWSQPAARMREFVQAVQAIWASWADGTPLRFEGEFYRHTLMPPMMVPEPTNYPHPRIVLAAVNPRMAQVAGEVADGLHCHGFCTPAWLEQVIIPSVEKGLSESGRKRSEFEISTRSWWLRATTTRPSTEPWRSSGPLLRSTVRPRPTGPCWNCTVGEISAQNCTDAA